MCVLLARSRWIHPGANVGVDLFLWLAFIVTALFSTGGAVSELSASSSSSSSYYSPSASYYNDSYYTYPNGTSYLITPSHPAPPCPGFDSCAQQDRLQREIRTRGAVVAAASALAWAMVLCHFALFVSACRYTHVRRRERRGEGLWREKLEGEAQRIEEKVIRKLEDEGRLVPAVQRPQAVAVAAGAPGVASCGGALPARVSGLRVYGAREDGGRVGEQHAR